MNYQHVQTAGTADVIGIKERRPARRNQARQPSSSTTLRPERGSALPGQAARAERAEPAEPPLGSGSSLGRAGPRLPGMAEERRFRSASGVPITLRRRQHSASCRELAVRGPRLQLRSLSAATSAVWLAAYGLFALSEVPAPPPPSGLAAARARRRLRPSLPRAEWPRVSPEQLWLAAPGAWRAAGARGKVLSATLGHPPRPGNAELMSACWQRESSATLRAAGCHLLAPVASRVPLLVCSLVTDRVDVCLGAERWLAHVCEYK